MKNPKKLAGWALILVGGIDLALGNTSEQILPAAVANLLTQQVDLALVGVGVLLVFVL